MSNKLLIPLLVALWVRPIQAQTPLAVVVNPDSAVDALSLEELRRLYLGQTTVWDDTDVRLYEFGAERGTFYKSVLDMSESQLDRHWIGVVFRGGQVPPPTKVSDPGELLRLVSQTPGAVAFLPFEAVTSAVKILSIEGARPGDSSYPIH
jgi:ABC-type phosphate transport system substrate-binding protein